MHSWPDMDRKNRTGIIGRFMHRGAFNRLDMITLRIVDFRDKRTSLKTCLHVR